MKKIFMASLVAMMAVTTANAQIASTEYTDATFVAKDGFDALVGGTTQVTANKSAIATINGRVGNISKENMGTKAGTVVEAIKEVVTEKADKATTYTKDEADAEFMTSAEVTDAISNATSADSAQVAANKASIEGMKSDIQGLHNSKQFKSDADYQMGNSKGEWTTMTQKQQNALNSGVTSATVDHVATNKASIEAINDSAVMNSGVTADVVAKANSAMQETGLKALESWGTQKCATQGVTCSLVSKSGVIAWEAVKY
jgi:ribosome-associated translation inhibitor RaiA